MSLCPSQRSKLVTFVKASTDGMEVVDALTTGVPHFVQHYCSDVASGADYINYDGETNGPDGARDRSLYTIQQADQPVLVPLGKNRSRIVINRAVGKQVKVSVWPAVCLCTPRCIGGSTLRLCHKCQGPYISTFVETNLSATTMVPLPKAGVPYQWQSNMSDLMEGVSILNLDAWSVNGTGNKLTVMFCLGTGVLLDVPVGVDKVWANRSGASKEHRYVTWPAVCECGQELARRLERLERKVGIPSAPEVWHKR